MGQNSLQSQQPQFKVAGQLDYWNRGQRSQNSQAQTKDRLGGFSFVSELLQQLREIGKVEFACQSSS